MPPWGQTTLSLNRALSGKFQWAGNWTSFTKLWMFRTSVAHDLFFNNGVSHLEIKKNNEMWISAKIFFLGFIKKNNWRFFKYYCTFTHIFATVNISCNTENVIGGICVCCYLLIASNIFLWSDMRVMLHADCIRKAYQC